MPKRNILLVLFVLSTIIISQPNSKLSITITNSSFEVSSNKNIPNGWTISKGKNVLRDNSVSTNGEFSISLINEDWDQSEVLSQDVTLKIGELYKLSAWAKTEDVITNPMDRYPTSVGGCITMQSFPFTNHSSTIGATSDWTKIEAQFIATKSTDRIRLHLGYNGNSKGKIWFDNVILEKLDDISDFIPLETVKWFGDGFRYDDQGWINVHIEGKPYERGYQYGYLVAEEIVEYINKLGIQVFKEDPKKG